MQNKARLELADYEAVSERGVFITPASPSSNVLHILLSGFISCLFLHTDPQNFCFFPCATASLVTFLSPKAITWITGLVMLRYSFFCTWAGIIKDGIQPCTVHITCSKHNQPRSLKPPPPPHCSLFHLQESLARLQRAFARKWEFIFMQAEAQAK